MIQFFQHRRNLVRRGHDHGHHRLSGHAKLCGRNRRRRLGSAYRSHGCAGDQGRFHAVRGLDLSRSTSLAGSASRLREAFRPARDHDRRLSKGCAAASAQGICRRFQPQSRQRGVGKESRLRLFQLGNRLWNTDSSFKRLPARASLLYARSIPPVGGHTEFADERAAYDALPGEMKRRLDRLVAEHSIFNSRARLGFTNFSDDERRGMPPVPQVVVRTLPESGRKSLYLASHAGRIFGMPEHEGRALIDELIAHATQRQFVYTHRWRVNDLVMWDNRCTMHRGTEFDDLRWKRDVQRATVCDVANSCEQEGIEIAAA